MPVKERNGRDLAPFAELLRSARVEHGISQKQLADTLGVGQSSVAAWETGNAEPDRDFVFRCEAIFGMSEGGLSSHLGYGPPRMPGGRRKGGGTTEAILLDPKLNKDAKDFLLRAYKMVTTGGRSRSRCTELFARQDDSFILSVV